MKLYKIRFKEMMRLINLVFYNSYQNSYIGFQSSQYLVGSTALTTYNEDYSKFEETEKLLTNSGCICALGESQNGEGLYFVYRGLSTCDENGVEWYVNLGIEADSESAEQFCNVITNMLLDFNSFKNSLENWFITTPDDSFSYDLNFKAVDKYILEARNISIDDIEFYKMNNPYISKFRKMLLDIKKGNNNALLLLVPETSLNYFYKQNQFFENLKKEYVFNANVFNGLIKRDKAAIEQYEEKHDNEKTTNNERMANNAQYTKPNDDPIGAFIEENKHTIELACKIAIGTLAIVGTGVLIKKIFF